MQLYGYKDEGLPPEKLVTSTLAEVTLAARPQELRTMAAYLLAVADEMDRMAEAYDHLHLCDAYKEFEASPHFVVVRDNSV